MIFHLMDETVVILGDGIQVNFVKKCDVAVDGRIRFGAVEERAVQRLIDASYGSVDDHSLLLDTEEDE